MMYRIIISEVAEAEAEAAHLWMMGRSPERAGAWYDGLLRAIESLAEMPRRCPRASESAFFPIEVRQLLYGRYRILYSLVDSDGDGEEGTIRILHVRYVSQPPLSLADDEQRGKEA